MITVAAPAKINLYLHVTGRRDDGYHELDSLIAFADIHDTIATGPAPALSLTIDGPFADTVAGGNDNLVMRAARALADRAGVRDGASIRLTKRLPVAAGIGGGSADAAATLRALSALWQLTVPGSALMEIGLALGADVPVCLAGHAAFVGGIGERVERAPALPDAGIVLANPLQALATPAVFKARAGPFSAGARFDRAPATVEDLAGLLAERRNDLSEAAASLCPSVRDVLAALKRSPGAALVRMSGSGATCFALYTSIAAARTAADRLAAEHSDWWVDAGRLISEPRGAGDNEAAR